VISLPIFTCRTGNRWYLKIGVACVLVEEAGVNNVKSVKLNIK